jgi:hypothetical protein
MVVEGSLLKLAALLSRMKAEKFIKRKNRKFLSDIKVPHVH